MESEMSKLPSPEESKRKDSLPAHVLEGIKKSIEQYENGEYISLEEFKEKHFTKRNR